MSETEKFLLEEMRREASDAMAEMDVMIDCLVKTKAQLQQRLFRVGEHLAVVSKKQVAADAKLEVLIKKYEHLEED